MKRLKINLSILTYIEKRDISNVKILISFTKLFQKIRMFEELGNQIGANSK